MIPARDLRRFEATLRKERSALLALLTAHGCVEPEPGGYYHNHPAEVASALYEHEEAVSVKAWLQQRLVDVDAAFQRVRNGTYGRCAICGVPAAEADEGVLEVDHCHDTGVVRGLLCGPCNRGIGNLGDSPELLRKATDYLARFRLVDGSSGQERPLAAT